MEIEPFRRASLRRRRDKASFSSLSSGVSELLAFSEISLGDEVLRGVRFFLLFRTLSAT